MKFASKSTAAAFAAACAALLGSGFAQAGTIIGLVDGNALAMIDGTSRKVTSTIPVKGAATLIHRFHETGRLHGIHGGDGSL